MCTTFVVGELLVHRRRWEDDNKTDRKYCVCGMDWIIWLSKRTGWSLLRGVTDTLEDSFSGMAETLI
jgi:tRNA(Ile2) C34 agmatinyltransferase TiaS